MSDVRKPDARETALEVLMQVDSANAWSDGGLKRTIAKNKRFIIIASSFLLIEVV